MTNNPLEHWYCSENEMILLWIGYFGNPIYSNFCVKSQGFINFLKS